MSNAQVSATEVPREGGQPRLQAVSYVLILAVLLGAVWPSRETIALAAGLGFVGYGVSLVLFVLALREIGTTRTIAFFSVAPFIGTVLGIVAFGEPLTRTLLFSGILMALGVWITTTGTTQST